MKTKVRDESFHVPTIVIALFVWLALFLWAAGYVHAEEPSGIEVGTKTGIHGQEAVAFFGARCGEQFSLWVLLDNGHMIYFDDKDGPVVGELLKQLAGKPSDFHDFCSESM